MNRETLETQTYTGNPDIDRNRKSFFHIQMRMYNHRLCFFWEQEASRLREIPFLIKLPIAFCHGDVTCLFALVWQWSKHGRDFVENSRIREVFEKFFGADW